MSQPKTPLGNKRQQRMRYNERASVWRNQHRSQHVFIGEVVGVSSPDKGFIGSKHDTERDFFKFLVRFEDLKANRFVIPDKDSYYWYDTIGWNEDSYKGMAIVCKYNSSVLPIGNLRGVVDVGFVKKVKAQVKSFQLNPEVKDINEYLVTGYSPYKNSYDFNCGAFSGIMDPAASFLVSKSFGD